MVVSMSKNNKFRILIVPSWYPTEDEPIKGIFFKEQAMALQRVGCDITVAYPELWSLRTLGKSKREKGISFCIEDNLPTYRFKGFNIFPKTAYLRGNLYNDKLKRLYIEILKNQGKPDIIHAHSFFWGGYAASKLSKNYNIPLVVTEHSRINYNGIFKLYRKNIIKSIANTASYIISVGLGLIKEFKEFHVEGKLIMIPNMVDTDKFKPELIHYTKNDTFKFFYLGLLTPNKNVDLLIKAFSQVFRKKNAQLIIGGYGKERRNLEKLAIKLKIRQQVIFLGQLSRNEVIDQINQCNTVVLPSRYETFGVVLIEALSCGKPVIATKSGGPNDIVNGSNGYLVPVGNINKLSDAMLNVKNNYNKFNPVEIRENCINKYSERVVINKLLNLYSRLIKDN